MLKKTLIVAAVAAAAVPGTAAAQRGVVVKVDRASALTAVAGARGSVALVHTKARVHVGQRVSYRGRALRNGTFAGTAVKVVGRAKSVRVTGIVLAHRRGGYLLSAHGAVLRVNAHARRTTASASDSGLPKVGSEVSVTATFSDDDAAGDDLDETSVTPVAATALGGSIEGDLRSVSATSIVVADDGLALQINVPAGFDTSKFAVGDEVLATFSQQSDGTLVLTALAGNENVAEADDETEIEIGDDDGGSASEQPGGDGGSAGEQPGDTSGGGSSGGDD